MEKKLKDFVSNKNSKKFLFTAGPSSLVAENLSGLGPCFGRNDSEYIKVEEKVLSKLKRTTKFKVNYVTT